ncbi:MAG: 4Fe-4S binding protein, partial [Bacteroidales bacterium]|nr:4Fe-4S binding protein [Bacteroidales bacterium]
YDRLEEELQKCMLCGKCTLVCPRGVNLRSLIINMRQILSNTTEILA